MDNQDLTASFEVNESPKQVFDAITNVRGWWSENIEGGTSELNREFTYEVKDLHRCTMRLIEVIPNQKVVWQVLDNYFSFVKDQSEWKDTKIVFEVQERGGKTRVQFTHQGLVPAHECYGICADAWTGYITGSLHDLITTGKGKPNPKKN
ncbi:SRPBCC family protein [Mucilaginibacter flavus]|uniref:SRPBCC family protein n=1 Tax=Mucilaginibacter flavus TaxID=931504 RepID=UPI0025B3A521|nr:SRPBCC domain-containing protein [Mucilaginibacter flavus]MDN3584334.1 SRPBCC domain-containing protein [Mucilaginibacter flavus]